MKQDFSAARWSKVGGKLNSTRDSGRNWMKVREHVIVLELLDKVIAGRPPYTLLNQRSS
jgi:hypothetical protein